MGKINNALHVSKSNTSGYRFKCDQPHSYRRVTEVQKLLTLDVDELFGNAELSFIQTVIVGDIALRFRHWDDHTFLLLPEHLLS